MTTTYLCAHCERPLAPDGHHLAPDGTPGFLYVQVCQDCGTRFRVGDPWCCPQCGSRNVRDDHVGLPVPAENLTSAT